MRYGGHQRSDSSEKSRGRSGREAVVEYGEEDADINRGKQNLENECTAFREYRRIMQKDVQTEA